jgi:aspartate-semialdehyde dehydrogenase
VTRLVILDPTTLLGKELVEVLERRSDLWQEMALLSLADEEVGALTEAAGAAALVRRAEAADLAAADVVFVCGSSAAYADLLTHRRADATVVYLDPRHGGAGAVPVVAGINLDEAAAGGVLASPHPATVLLAHLLQPLVAAGLREAAAMLVQPASIFGRPGLDELYAQAQSLVALQPQEPSAVFGRQLAFNLYPAPGGPAGLAEEARAVLGPAGADLRLAVQLLQGAVFHGFSALLHVYLAGDPEPESVRERLAGNPLVGLSEPAEGEADDLLGPIDAAAEEKVVVGPVRRDPAGGLWIWAVMDNLTRGGALNALAILERVVATLAVH